LIRARLYGSEVYAKFMDDVFDKNKHAMQGKHPIIQGNIKSFTISYITSYRNTISYTMSCIILVIIYEIRRDIIVGETSPQPGPQGLISCETEEKGSEAISGCDNPSDISQYDAKDPYLY
jgi:hypothetical protein